MRWASLSIDPHSGQPRVRDDYDIDPSWDRAEHDYLGDFHSSHVNPLFWKLHGWVDDCIDVWFTAHEHAHPGQVKRADVRGIPWFEYGSWVVKKDPFDWPGAGHSHGGGHYGEGHSGGGRDHGDHDEIATLEKVMMRLKQIADRPAPPPKEKESVATKAADAGIVEAEVPSRRLFGFARFSDVTIPGE